MSLFEAHHNGFTISTDPARLDISIIFDYLNGRSYWAAGRPRDVLEKALKHSLNFGVYGADGAQIGFARIISDYATFAYLCDVFVLEAQQGAGLGKWLIECVRAHPDLQHLRRWMLATRDAHGLYRQYGFAELADPSKWMESFQP